MERIIKLIEEDNVMKDIGRSQSVKIWCKYRRNEMVKKGKQLQIIKDINASGQKRQMKTENV